MTLNQLTIKYTKLALQGSSIKKDTPEQITANCPMCGDRKHRFSVSAVKDDIGVAGCFNAGCSLENGLPFPAFLKMHDENLYQQYRKEKFNADLGIISKNGSTGGNLNYLLDIAKNKESKEPNEPKEPKEPILGNIKLPEIFGCLKKLPDVPEAVKYIENRCIEKDIYQNWYFSEEKFIKVLDKTYFVQNYVFIPIIQRNKLKGFYTRSIEEKRFSTILFPSADKYWSSEPDVQGKDFYIFEGIFDALSSGLPKTIAMLSADLSQDLLDDLDDPVFIFDNDKTGKKKALEIVEKGYRVFIWPEEWESYKDMNEILTSGTLKELIAKNIKDNIHRGFQAKIKISLRNL
jgi:hypothetical protein